MFNLLQHGNSYSFEENPVIPPEGETTAQAYDRRRKLLNNNQVQAATYFVRRVQAFMKYVVKKKAIAGGTLKDWVIRYETQGRGSVHAHMLWWIDIDPEYQHKDDVIDLSEEIERAYHLFETDEETHRDYRLYDKELLNYTNGHVWALKELESIKKKLRIIDDEDEDFM